MQPFISTEWYRALFIGKQSKKSDLERKAQGKISKVKEKYKGDLQNWPKSGIKLMLGFELIFTSCLEKNSPARRKHVWKDINLLDVYKYL